MANDSEARLRRVEDQLAIYQLLAAHPCAVDSGNADVLGSIYAEHGVYEVGEAGRFDGRAAVESLVTMPQVVELMAAGAGHVATLPYVVIDGDRAVATGHGMVVIRDKDGFSVNRLSAMRYELERQADGEWRIALRTIHLLDGNRSAPALLGRLTEISEPLAA
jgi:ketosteroid isomerase-like protein